MRPEILGSDTAALAEPRPQAAHASRQATPGETSPRGLDAAFYFRNRRRQERKQAQTALSSSWTKRTPPACHRVTTREMKYIPDLGTPQFCVLPMRSSRPLGAFPPRCLACADETHTAGHRAKS